MHKQTNMSIFHVDSMRLLGKMGLSWVLYAGSTHLIVSSGVVRKVMSSVCDVMALHCEPVEDGPSKVASVARILALMSTYAVWVVHSVVSNKQS